jgi:hypothetical protein
MSSSPVMRLMLTFEHESISFTEEYIAQVFWDLQIAQVSTVTLCSDGVTAVVKINHWLDTEIAYDFVNAFKYSTHNTLLHYYNHEWDIQKHWIVAPLSHQVPDNFYGRTTRQFERCFFEPEEEEQEQEQEDTQEQEQEQEDTQEQQYYDQALYNTALSCCEFVIA